MPRNAIEHVEVDEIVPSYAIANTIVRMIDGDPGRGSDPVAATATDPAGDPVVTTCPECGGVLSEDPQAGLVQWRCKVGHRYSPASLADAQAEGVEATIWAAVRSLEDRRELLERIARDSERRGATASARVFRQRAEQAGAQARAVRDALAMSLSGTLRTIEDEPPIDELDERRRAEG